MNQPEQPEMLAAYRKWADENWHIYPSEDAWIAATLAERERCAKLCEAEYAEFLKMAGYNNGRESDFAFGSVNSAERIAAAIRRGEQP